MRAKVADVVVFEVPEPLAVEVSQNGPHLAQAKSGSASGRPFPRSKEVLRHQGINSNTKIVDLTNNLDIFLIHVCIPLKVLRTSTWEAAIGFQTPEMHRQPFKSTPMATFCFNLIQD